MQRRSGSEIVLKEHLLLADKHEIGSVGSFPGVVDFFSSSLASLRRLALSHGLCRSDDSGLPTVQIFFGMVIRYTGRVNKG